MTRGLRRSLVTAVDPHWLLVVASDEAVVRASREVAAFLACRRARLSDEEEHGRSVIGIWVDSMMVDAAPPVLDGRSASCPGQFHVRASIGMNGIWSLWWLDMERAGAAPAIDTVRESLIAILAATGPPRGAGRAPRFVPVFGIEQHPFAIHVEMKRLRERRPRLIGEPLRWDRATGALRRVCEPHRCDCPESP